MPPCLALSINGWIWDKTLQHTSVMSRGCTFTSSRLHGSQRLTYLLTFYNYKISTCVKIKPQFQFEISFTYMCRTEVVLKERLDNPQWPNMCFAYRCVLEGQLKSSYENQLSFYGLELRWNWMTGHTDTNNNDMTESPRLMSHSSESVPAAFVTYKHVCKPPRSFIPFFGVHVRSETRVCVTALCAGAGQMASCLALEAYSAACQAKGIAVGAWRENTPCGKWSILITFKPSKWSTLNDFKLLPPAFQCPDRSSPAECVDSSSCPALLHPGSLASGCSEGCQCHYGNVFDGGECVPYSQCGCVLHGVYIKVNIHALYILKETLSAVVGCIQILYFKSINIAPWKYCIKNHQWYINLN